jgi:LysM repeat protein
MTSENKLALVVGFALILLVGILISDHFSAARMQRSAELTSGGERLNPERWEDPDLIAMNTGQTDASAWANEPVSEPVDDLAADPAKENDRATDPLGGLRPNEIRMGGNVETPSIGLPPAERTQRPERFHVVKDGEYLSTICQHYYHDASLANELARFNGLDDPNDIRAGRQLRIPAREALVRGGQPRPLTPREAETSRHNQSQPAERPEVTTYTVQKNDNLSTIAAKFLGSANRYRIIYEHNRDVLSSPDDLKPGTVLKIPPRHSD